MRNKLTNNEKLREKKTLRPDASEAYESTYCFWFNFDFFLCSLPTENEEKNKSTKRSSTEDETVDLVWVKVRTKKKYRKTQRPNRKLNLKLINVKNEFSSMLWIDVSFYSAVFFSILVSLSRWNAIVYKWNWPIFHLIAHSVHFSFSATSTANAKLMKDEPENGKKPNVPGSRQFPSLIYYLATWNANIFFLLFFFPRALDQTIRSFSCYNNKLKCPCIFREFFFRF